MQKHRSDSAVLFYSYYLLVAHAAFFDQKSLLKAEYLSVSVWSCSLKWPKIAQKG